MAEKDGHGKLEPRGDTVRWVTLDVVGAEEGDPDLVPNGEQRARPRLPEYAVAGPVS